jgi:hypothetical protein
MRSRDVAELIAPRLRAVAGGARRVTLATVAAHGPRWECAVRAEVVRARAAEKVEGAAAKQMAPRAAEEAAAAEDCRMAPASETSGCSAAASGAATPPKSATAISVKAPTSRDISQGADIPQRSK